MASTRHAHLLIVGGGPAGYTAAIYAARANLHPVLIQGLQPGGQLMITTEVENYPGFAEAVMGPWLMDQFTRQAEHCGAEHVADIVTEVDLSARPFRLTCDSGAVYRRRADRRHRRPGALARARQRVATSRASASRPAPPATASSSAASRWRSSAAATPRSRRRSTSRSSPPGHPDPPPRPAAGPRRSCRTACSAPPTSRSCGATSSRRWWARTSPRASPASGCARCGPARSASSRSTACSSPSATTRRPGCSPASLKWTRRAIS